MTQLLDQNKIQQFRSLEFLARQVVEGFITGLHKSPFHGFSVEFAEHRLYNSGESIRNIDWKLYGRTDRLYVKRYEEETNLRCHLVIDNSSSMHFPVLKQPSLEKPNKITFSVYAAAALMLMMRKQRDAAGLQIFSDHLELSTPVRSSVIHHKNLNTELEKLLQPVVLRSKKGTKTAEALHLVAEKIHQRSLVILFTDMFENEHDPESLFSALQHLKHNKHEVVLFHVTYKSKEEKLDYPGRPHRFIDMETGAEIKVNPAEVKEKYSNLLSAYKKEIVLRCAQYHIDWVEADIEKGFDQILFPYLVKRQKLL